ncbi:MAG: hypothetical protein IJA10_11275 [Lachnospiraceae bacterium]|nr:hypothetical protein [Lachnospiraceae bacterium]
MDKNTVIETAYKTIKNNAEWGIECENKTFGYFVDGIIAMTDAMLERINKSCKADE